MFSSFVQRLVLVQSLFLLQSACATCKGDESSCGMPSSSEELSLVQRHAAALKGNSAAENNVGSTLSQNSLAERRMDVADKHVGPVGDFIGAAVGTPVGDLVGAAGDSAGNAIGYPVGGMA